MVTKNQPISVVNDTILAGIRCFGVNFTKEAEDKVEFIGMRDNIEWHMIVHIQSRKNYLVAKYFDMIHSIDNYKNAKKNRFHTWIHKHKYSSVIAI